MGLLDVVLGNATEALKNEVNELFDPILISDESISHAFVVGMRDLFVITNKRFIVLDRTEVVYGKVKISSHPWTKVSSWTYWNSNRLDFDPVVYIHVENQQMPIVVKFPKTTDLRPIVKSISEHVL